MEINHSITILILNINQSITDKLTFNINPYFYTSTIDNVVSDYNSNYYGIRPGITYKLTEKTDSRSILCFQLSDSNWFK